MSLQAATEVRRRLLAGGFHVLPTVGKIPAPKRWQSLHAGETDIAVWSRKYPDAINTGVLCGAVSVIDLDIYDDAMADQAEAMVRNIAGAGLVRYGQRPKRALFFRAIAPFKKIATPAFIAPDGQACRVEVLGAGQQCVVDGRHPDTGQNYIWPDGELTSLADLPEISEATARIIVTTAESMMVTAGWPAEKPKVEAPIAPTLAPGLDVDAIYGQEIAENRAMPRRRWPAALPSCRRWRRIRAGTID